ncbi:hypothetical protein [Methylobrevis pamukkalensis]|uniref:Four helix bundle sensory module for signal transduction n=1 Tax=Methylobrevis pamukkalensis TaxID=1439726 RepID=A0A1E3GX09_9HYPH|nr:hypothetical protein [Methylobrevis pamukkalensis]ODN68592.1 hypothetical protein A6302_04104 [Methylobrevis pamukkalensis]
MTRTRNWRNTLSLVSAGRVFVAVTMVYAVVAAALSMTFLDRIETDARVMQEQRLPAILDQNRNAVKVEKLASMVRSAYLARDPQLERQIHLQTRALAQSFSFDGDQILVKGGREIAEGVRRIVDIRNSGRMRPGDVPREEAMARATYDEVIRIATGLGEYLISDAALIADNMSADIRMAATRIRDVWILILARRCPAPSCCSGCSRTMWSGRSTPPSTAWPRSAPSAPAARRRHSRFSASCG